MLEVVESVLLVLEADADDAAFAVVPIDSSAFRTADIIPPSADEEETELDADPPVQLASVVP